MPKSLMGMKGFKIIIMEQSRSQIKNTFLVPSHGVA